MERARSRSAWNCLLDLSLGLRATEPKSQLSKSNSMILVNTGFHIKSSFFEIHQICILQVPVHGITSRGCSAGGCVSVSAGGGGGGGGGRRGVCLRLNLSLAPSKTAIPSETTAPKSKTNGTSDCLPGQFVIWLVIIPNHDADSPLSVLARDQSFLMPSQHADSGLPHVRLCLGQDGARALASVFSCPVSFSSFGVHRH